jgi:hypothetical protein
MLSSSGLYDDEAPATQAHRIGAPDTASAGSLDSKK